MELTVPTDLARLTLADRVSLRVGLWLLLRTQRDRTPQTAIGEAADTAFLFRDRRVSSHEAMTLMAYQYQRQMF